MTLTVDFILFHLIAQRKVEEPNASTDLGRLTMESSEPRVVRFRLWTVDVLGHATRTLPFREYKAPARSGKFFKIAVAVELPASTPLVQFEIYHFSFSDYIYIDSLLRKSNPGARKLAYFSWVKLNQESHRCKLQVCLSKLGS